ncbi:MAG: NAD(P)(+) transhydrogenase (Re/Si-specific) subunit alpha, partial [Bacteroidota bacterium]
AAVTGGNCALTQNDQTVVVNGVSIIGNSNLAAEMSQDASRLYSNNVFNFFSHVFREAELNLEDEITAATLVQTP